MTIGEAWIQIYTTALVAIAGSDKYKDKTHDEVVTDAYRLAKYAMRKSHAEMVALGAYSTYTALAPTGAQNTQVAADVPAGNAFAQPVVTSLAPPSARKGVPPETPAYPPE